MAQQRNEGQFFKSLYRADNTPIIGEDVSQLKVLMAVGFCCYVCTHTCVHTICPLGAGRRACTGRAPGGIVIRASDVAVWFFDGRFADGGSSGCSERAAILATCGFVRDACCCIWHNYHCREEVSERVEGTGSCQGSVKVFTHKIVIIIVVDTWWSMVHATTCAAAANAQSAAAARAHSPVNRHGTWRAKRTSCPRTLGCVPLVVPETESMYPSDGCCIKAYLHQLVR